MSKDSSPDGCTDQATAISTLGELKDQFIEHILSKGTMEGYEVIDPNTSLDGKPKPKETVVHLIRWKSQVVVFLMERSANAELYEAKIFLQDLVRRNSSNPNSGRSKVAPNRSWDSVVTSVKGRQKLFEECAAGGGGNGGGGNGQVNAKTAAQIIVIPGGQGDYILSAHLDGLTQEQALAAQEALRPFVK